MYNELANLQQMYLDGEIATEEEYKARQAEIINHYYGEDGVLATYANLYNIAVRTDADATNDNWQKNYGEMTQHTEDWKIAVNKYLEEIGIEFEGWKITTEKANEDVGGALGNSEQATKDLKDESTRLKEVISKDVVPAIGKEIDAVKLQIIEYGKSKDAIDEMIKSYEKYLELLDQDIEEASTIESPIPNPPEDSSSKLPEDSPSEPPKEESKPSLAIGQSVTVKTSASRFTRDGGRGTKMQSWVPGSTFTVMKIDGDEVRIGRNGVVTGWVKRSDLEGFFTGGYTGKWGPEGKLAMLHEKELVLNKEDTSNLLKTVGFIREIISMIDSQAYMSSVFNMSASSGIATGNETLEQTVTIHAEFPNATNHNEIEEAFNNLINTASQYANRK